MGGAHRNLAAAAIFILAALTDWFDGFLARKWNQTSSFGAFLDPVADKLMVTAALLILVQISRVDAAIALVIVGREIAISALREWMAQIGASKSVAVNQLGKFKTACQMVAIPMLLFYGPLPLGIVTIDTRVWGEWLMYLAAVLTIWSMLYYMKLAWPQIRERGGA
jgi:CDP-diacylglycerol--glycerol-3-phosphate 3-phosphatidyltransferase